MALNVFNFSRKKKVGLLVEEIGSKNELPNKGPFADKTSQGYSVKHIICSPWPDLRSVGQVPPAALGDPWSFVFDVNVTWFQLAGATPAKLANAGFP